MVQSEGRRLSFSQRAGLSPMRRALQMDSMDARLRNRLWNAVWGVYWEAVQPSSSMFVDLRAGMSYLDGPWERALITTLWDQHLGLDIADLPGAWPAAREAFRSIFYRFSWHEVYDFIEALLAASTDEELNQEFVQRCNSLLEAEGAGYRLLGGQVVDIISPQEVQDLEAALQATAGLASIKTHLLTSLELYADRDAPDYRNSIKESISAVESLCGLIVGRPGVTLGDALRKLDTHVDTHPALREAFNKIYGYTSDAQGIRHSLQYEPTLHSEDAQWMLVACSAFVNYLIAKAARAGIQLGQD